MQGNCSEADAASVLGLSAEEAAGVLPLKPRQCLIITHEPFLLSMGGHLWMDGLYLKSLRQTLREQFTFVSAGHQTREDAFDVPRCQMYLTNLTVQSEPGRSAIAVALLQGFSSLLVTGVSQRPPLHPPPVLDPSNTHQQSCAHRDRRSRRVDTGVSYCGPSNACSVPGHRACSTDACLQHGAGLLFWMVALA